LLKFVSAVRSIRAAATAQSYQFADEWLALYVGISLRFGDGIEEFAPYLRIADVLRNMVAAVWVTRTS
jgi:hypothetical protein